VSLLNIHLLVDVTLLCWVFENMENEAFAKVIKGNYWHRGGNSGNLFYNVLSV
jgi:hypothetical protein